MSEHLNYQWPHNKHGQADSGKVNRYLDDTGYYYDAMAADQDMVAGRSADPWDGQAQWALWPQWQE